MKILLAIGAALALGWTQTGSQKTCCVMPPRKPLADQIAEAKAKMATDPDQRFLFHTLSAEKAIEDQQPAEAIPHYREAARLRPESPYPLADLGYLYLAFMHDTKPVFELYSRALKLGGSIMIPVRHEHSPLGWCEGRLSIQRYRLSYTADSAKPKSGASHGLNLEREEVKSFTAVSGTAGGMRMIATQYSMDFVPLEQPQALRDLALKLYAEH